MNSRKIGIYMRLSRDDEKAGESTSIESQRVILKRFVEERGGTVAEEYSDDGWSGTDFERPSVKRMLSDAQSGKIDTIIVKDLSRFGRNYIQVGQYIDYIFPAYGVRFIAINDNIDTCDRGSTAMDMMPIMNVFNEWHAANTSKKIRAVLEASRRSGRYTGWNYPYGYRAGEDKDRTAVIDDEAAAVVRRIFALRAQGNSARAIARILTDEGVSNPATYYTKRDGAKQNRICSPFWCPSTVSGILSNATYLGETVQHKTTTVSYKNHKVIAVPPNARIVKTNAHEPIISRELWDKVQTVNKSVARGKPDKNNAVHALSGLLVCADCGKKLKLKGGSFYCRTYIDLGKKYCTSHAVKEKLIEGVVLGDIRSMLGNAVFDGVSERRNKEFDEKRLKVCNNRLAELDKLMRYAFEASVLKKMPESVCEKLCGDYLAEQTSLEAEIGKIKSRLADGDGEYARKVKSYCEVNALSRELCLQLVEYIAVGERTADGARPIKIFYKLRPRKP